MIFSENEIKDIQEWNSNTEELVDVFSKLDTASEAYALAGWCRDMRKIRYSYFGIDRTLLEKVFTCIMPEACDVRVTEKDVSSQYTYFEFSRDFLEEQCGIYDETVRISCHVTDTGAVNICTLAYEYPGFKKQVLGVYEPKIMECENELKREYLLYRDSEKIKDNLARQKRCRFELYETLAQKMARLYRPCSKEISKEQISMRCYC